MTAGKPAAGPPPSELARQLVLEFCVARLLGHLFPTGQEFPERQGRHRVLADLVARSPRLHRALLDGDEGEIHQAWSACLSKHRTDLRLHHTLAVLYHERALAGPADTDSDTLVFATALWALVLSTRAFWDQVSDNVVKWQSELLTTVAKELFTRHATAGRRALALGQVEAAEPHLRCLVAGHSGAAALGRTLMNFGLPYRHTVDEHLMGQVSSVARGVLDEWCAEIVRTAQKTVDDPEAIAKLPEGVSNNWAGGIGALEPFVRVGVPVKQVLRTGLEWYVEWWYVLNQRKELDRIADMLESAARFADGLILLCAKGEGHKRENQVLSRYFMFRGFAADDPAEQTKAQDEALEWNPSNDNAKNLRMDAQVGELLDRAYAAIDRGDFAEAESQMQAAATLRDDPAGQARLRKQLAPAYNAMGVAVLNAAEPAREKFEKALTEILESVKTMLPGVSRVSSSVRLGSLDRADLGSGCAVSDSSTGAPHRRTVVFTIIDEVITKGGFQAASALTFWRTQKHLLCASCRDSLTDLAEAKKTARNMFWEAISMDPHGTSARDNLRTIDEMDW